MAQGINGKTLEMTRVGQFLEKTNASIESWKAASLNFANQASGKVISVQNSAGIKLESVWATIEYNTLVNNPKVTEIVFSIINRNGVLNYIK